MTTLQVKVAAGADDGYADSGSISASGINTFLAGTGYRTFFRFLAVTIPQGATINSATLTVYRISTSGSTVSVTISADAADNSAQMTSGADAFGRTLTSGSATSTGSGATNSAQVLNVATAVQAVVNRAGWVSGNALQLIGTATGFAINIRAYDSGNSAQYATLDVDYTVGGGSTAPALYVAPSVAATNAACW